MSAPMPAKHRCQLNKVCCKRGTATSNGAVNLNSKGKIEIEGAGEKQ
jgi:hypothetical protein